MSKKAILLIILLLNLPNTVFADIYKWKDENGSVHFSDSSNSIPENAEKITEDKKPTRITGGYFEERIYRIPQPVQQIKLPDPPKYWNDPETSMSYKMPINEYQIKKDRQRIREEKRQLETVQASAGAFFLLIILSAIMYICIWIWAFIDILKNQFAGNDKLVWWLTITMIPLLGIIAYVTIGRKQRLIKTEEEMEYE